MTPDPQSPTPDPSQLGADTQPETPTRDDSRDMAPVIADAGAGTGRHFATPPAAPAQGSTFAEQRQQGAAGTPDAPTGDVGHGQGMGHAEQSGDEDRGYNQSGYRGGLGSSGGREDLAERHPDTDPNPFTGGYDSGGTPQPPAAQTQHLGLNTPPPADAKPEADSAQ